MRLFSYIMMFILGANTLFAQMTDGEKAKYYYQNEQLDSAACYVEKVLSSPEFREEKKWLQFAGIIFREHYQERGNKTMLEKAISVFEKVLVDDSMDYSANYHLGSIYYEQGISIIKKLDYDTDILILETVQESCLELFREALPFLQKAYLINPSRKEVLRGLSALYLSMNDEQKKQEFDELLKNPDEKDR